MASPSERRIDAACTHCRPVLPAWRRSAGAEALRGDWSDQARQVVHEVGVHHRL
ncbi:hypothetical protein [Streptomyces sp. NPDC093808]|uniref:hypothetical protein n=1 Tax=Streptomyces sp. NPDC093808 TaxID=3154985 RepID=UPI003450827A